MAPDRDRSVTAMPPALCLVAVLALLLRVGFSLAPARGDSNQEAISWRLLPASSGKIEPPLTANHADANTPSAREPRSQGANTDKEIDRLAVLAGQQSKMLLLQFDADDSDSCRRMEKSTLSNREIRTLVESRFLPVRVTDHTRSGVKTPSMTRDLHRRYRIFAYPTLVVADREGRAVTSMVGCCSALTTYRFLTRALTRCQVAARESM